MHTKKVIKPQLALKTVFSSWNQHWIHCLVTLSVTTVCQLAAAQVCENALNLDRAPSMQTSSEASAQSSMQAGRQEFGKQLESLLYQLGFSARSLKTLQSNPELLANAERILEYDFFIKEFSDEYLTEVGKSLQIGPSSNISKHRSDDGALIEVSQIDDSYKALSEEYKDKSIKIIQDKDLQKGLRLASIAQVGKDLLRDEARLYWSKIFTMEEFLTSNRSSFDMDEVPRLVDLRMALALETKAFPPPLLMRVEMLRERSAVATKIIKQHKLHKNIVDLMLAIENVLEYDVWTRLGIGLPFTKAAVEKAFKRYRDPEAAMTAILIEVTNRMVFDFQNQIQSEHPQLDPMMVHFVMIANMEVLLDSRITVAPYFPVFRDLLHQVIFGFPEPLKASQVRSLLQKSASEEKGRLRAEILAQESREQIPNAAPSGREQLNPSAVVAKAKGAQPSVLPRFKDRSKTEIESQQVVLRKEIPKDADLPVLLEVQADEVYRFFAKRDRYPMIGWQRIQFSNEVAKHFKKAPAEIRKRWFDAITSGVAREGSTEKGFEIMRSRGDMAERRFWKLGYGRTDDRIMSYIQDGIIYLVNVRDHKGSWDNSR
jgi:hypothetical protein